MLYPFWVYRFFYVVLSAAVEECAPKNLGGVVYPVLGSSTADAADCDGGLVWVDGSPYLEGGALAVVAFVWDFDCVLLHVFIGGFICFKGYWCSEWRLLLVCRWSSWRTVT